MGFLLGTFFFWELSFPLSFFFVRVTTVDDGKQAI
jgi:hypothetical protein